MNWRVELGCFGEKAARQFMREQGFVILKRLLFPKVKPWPFFSNVPPTYEEKLAEWEDYQAQHKKFIEALRPHLNEEDVRVLALACENRISFDFAVFDKDVLGSGGHIALVEVKTNKSFLRSNQKRMLGLAKEFLIVVYLVHVRAEETPEGFTVRNIDWKRIA